MASIVERRNRFCVVYLYDDAESGKRKQKWESYKTMADAKRRKTEIEYKQELGTLVIHQCQTVDELMHEYVALYGKTTWSMSMYTGNIGLIKHYISPIIGNMKLNEVTARVLEKYYLQLLKTPSVARITQRKDSKEVHFIAPPTVRKIHNVLRSAFHQAVKWELMEKNPAMYATVPKAEQKKRDIWDAPTLFHAIEVCEDERLKLAINLSFACSLRIGELLGLTWDCVDISPESIAEGKAYVYVNKELQRVDKSVMKTLEKKDVLRVFPELRENNKTVLVLKKPKTFTSIRKIFLPRSVAEMLVDWKREQDFTREALGSEYFDFDLVMANSLGMPTEQSRITALFQELIDRQGLPRVVFHSLRHSSITYKLKLNGGDIKSVQGDSGHAQAQMVTDQYSHILDDDRKNNAELFERAFYSGKGTEVAEEESKVQADVKVAKRKSAKPKTGVGDVDPALLGKILANPELATLLTTLAKGLTQS